MCADTVHTNPYPLLPQEKSVCACVLSPEKSACMCMIACISQADAWKKYMEQRTIYVHE